MRDDVVTMFCKRMATIHKRGRDHLEVLRESHRAESERLLEVFGDVLSAVRQAAVPEAPASPDGQGDEPGAAADGPDGAETPEPGPVDEAGAAERAGRLVLATLKKAGGLEALATSHEAVSAHHGNNYLPLLDQHYRSHRSALFTLVDSIELESTSADRTVLDAVEFLKELRTARSAFVPETIVVKRQGPDGDTVKERVSINVDAFASNWSTNGFPRPGPGRLAASQQVSSHLISRLQPYRILPLLPGFPERFV